MIAQEKATQGLLESMGENLVSELSIAVLKLRYTDIALALIFEHRFQMSRGEDGIGGDSFGGFADSEVKGHLVQQILDTKKELEDATKKDVNTLLLNTFMIV